MVRETFRARRPLKIGPTVREPGALVPEAQTWFRVEHLVHSGQLVRVVVEDQEYDEAVKKYCPDLSAELGSSTEGASRAGSGSRQGARSSASSQQ